MLGNNPMVAFPSNRCLAFKNAETLGLLLITFCLKAEQFCLEGEKLVDRLSTLKKLLFFYNIAVAAKKRLKQTLWPSSAHSWVNVVTPQTETLTLLCEVTSAGHRSGAGFLPLRPLLFMILINWCQMSWEQSMQVERPLFQPTIDLN